MNNPSSIEIINDFISDYLDDDINNLVTFDIKQLKGIKKYGAPTGCSFDPDNTIIARAIMNNVFGDVWPGLNEETLRSMDYRGDTINTFNTMFGPLLNDGSFQGLNKFEVDNNTKKRVEIFYSLYTTIGNIVVLPNKYYGRYTLNTFRGTYSKWRDYFDRFLTNLHQYIIDGTADNDTFCQLMKANNEAFSQYKGAAGFSKLCDKLFLEEYLNTDGTVKELFPLTYWWNRNLTNDEYINSVNKYLDFTESFIARRGKIIVKSLKEII